LDTVNNRSGLSQ